MHYRPFKCPSGAPSTSVEKLLKMPVSMWEYNTVDVMFKTFGGRCDPTHSSSILCVFSCSVRLCSPLSCLLKATLRNISCLQQKLNLNLWPGLWSTNQFSPCPR